jgi:methionine-rich copper-binding protein CopC
MSSRRNSRNLLAGSLLAAGLALAAPMAASAHDSLVSTTPAEGTTVSQADSVELTFSGTLLSIGEDQRSAAIQVSHEGRYFEVACPKLVDKTATAEVALGEAGDYTVLWQVVSSDGHTISGEYSFDYEPAAEAEVSSGSDKPACGDPATAAGADGAPSDDTILLGAAAGVGALAIIGVVVAVIVGRRRRPFDGEAT